jgi:multiple sugar transport system ATP-binding protein
MRLEIKKLHNQLKNTIVYVTHDQVEAMTMATMIAVMNKGVIQQVGTPDEIYDLPENAFVADFLGSPAMNMLEGEVQARAGASGVHVRGPDGVSFDLSNYRWREAPGADRKVRVGFRPEHFLPPGEAPTGSVRFDLPVVLIEKAGPDAIAFLSLEGATIAARVDQRVAERYRREQVASLCVPLERLHVFDAATGRRM